ncbi:MAG: hypothetical protein ACT4PU_04875 [Planctomycetota bacterium]
MAEAALDRAEQLEGVGAEAREQAEAALAQARAAAWPAGIARGQLLLGRLDQDAARLVEARDIAVWLEHRPLEAAARLALSELLLATRQPQPALVETERGLAALHALTEPADIDLRAPVEQAALEAALWHRQAQALRTLGQFAPALSAARRAQLLLTQIGDEQAQGLRQEVALTLGDALLSGGDALGAFTQYARAWELARRRDDARAQQHSLAGQAEALLAMDRADDALLSWQRALELTLASGDRVAAASIARRALAMLDTQGEPADSARRLSFREALAPPVRRP